MLNAATGLLREFQSAFPRNAFHFGLLLADFRVSLGWQSKMGNFWERERRRTCFPIWSWVGWRTSGYIQFPSQVGFSIQPTLSIWKSNGEPIFVIYENGHGKVGREGRSNAFFCHFNQEVKQTLVPYPSDLERIPQEGHVIIHAILLEMRLITQHVSPGPASQICEFEAPDGTHVVGTSYINIRSAETTMGEPQPSDVSSEWRNLLLLAATVMNAETLELHFLLLKWEKKTAYRSGKITLECVASQLELLYECKPQYNKVILG